MHTTIMIPEEAFIRANELGEKSSNAGVKKVRPSEAVNYIISKKLNDLKRRKLLESSAGGWSDIDSDALIKDIYASRSKGTGREISF